MAQPVEGMRQTPSLVAKAALGQPRARRVTAKGQQRSGGNGTRCRTGHFRKASRIDEPRDPNPSMAGPVGYRPRSTAEPPDSAGTWITPILDAGGHGALYPSITAIASRRARGRLAHTLACRLYDPPPIDGGDHRCDRRRLEASTPRLRSRWVG